MFSKIFAIQYIKTQFISTFYTIIFLYSYTFGCTGYIFTSNVALKCFINAISVTILANISTSHGFKNEINTVRPT